MWVALGTVLNAVKRKFVAPQTNRTSVPRRSIHLPSHCNIWTIPAPLSLLLLMLLLLLLLSPSPWTTACLRKMLPPSSEQNYRNQRKHDIWLIAQLDTSRSMHQLLGHTVTQKRQRQFKWELWLSKLV
jgi:hypothetical protein